MKKLYVFICLLTITNIYSQIDVRSIHYEAGVFDEVDSTFYRNWSLNPTELKTIFENGQTTDYLVLDNSSNQVKVSGSIDGIMEEEVWIYDDWEYFTENEKLQFFLTNKNADFLIIDLKESMIVRVKNGEYFKYVITDWNLQNE
jgi:hypothetical protein